MNGFERRKQKKMERILEASHLLFARHGYQKVSVSEIAAEAGVSPATIYNYFGTKEQLHAAVTVDAMDRQLERYERILASELPFPEKTREILRLESELAADLLDELRSSASAGAGALRQAVDAFADSKLAGFFRRYVAIGKQEGYIHRDLSEETALAYFAMYRKELDRMSGNRAGGGHTVQLDVWLRLFFYGLAGP